MQQFEFVHPQLFWLLLLLPVVALWYFWKRKQQTAALRISSIKGFKTGKNWLAKLRPLLFVLRLLALAAIIVAMARPRTVDESTRIKTTKGIDIVITIDVSASMLARDLKPNRLEALKNVAARFINNRPNDRIGLV
jgi:Ca-activated chloride channel family protein